MPRRPLTTTVALAAIVIAAGACDDGSLGTSQPTVPFVPQPEATDPPFTTVGEISPEVVAARVHRIVIEILGVTLTVAVADLKGNKTTIVRRVGGNKGRPELLRSQR